MPPLAPEPRGPYLTGRYAIYDAIASGGMARVHLGRLLGPAGFGRTVAIKRLHAQFAENPDFVTMFLDEARLASRVRHPNVVPTLDVVAAEGELLLVMEYVHGEPLSRLLRTLSARKERIPLRATCAIVSSLLHGLHAAHEAKDEAGQDLGLVHRDVSPQNVLVGLDGVVRVADFGVAKAVVKAHTTREGELKGKFAYMAPEQLRRGPITRRTDVYAAAVVLWECLVGERLFDADNEAAIIEEALWAFVDAPSHRVPGVPAALDEIALRGLDRDPERRFATAREMALAIERALPPAMPSEVGEWVESVAGGVLAERAARIAQIEHESMAEAAAPTLTVSATAAASAAPPAEGAPNEPRSTVSVSKPIGKEERKGAGSLSIVLAGVLALGVVAGVVIALLVRTRAPEPIPGATTDPASTDSSTPSGAAASSAVPLPSALATAADTGSAEAPPLASSASKTPPTRPGHGKVRPDCDPPYTYDAEGRKIYKRNCPLN